MFEKIIIDGLNTLVSLGNFEVKIVPKIYGGYTLTKTVKDDPFKIIEIRDIRVPISEKEVVKEAKELLKRKYESIDFSKHCTT
ncbi:MAG: hypothetical protein ACRCU3_02845 [Eubacteriaceae bacterium]